MAKKTTAKKKVSKRMKELSKLIDRAKQYDIATAVKLVRETSKVKFDPTVELHVRLGIDPKKGEQQVRASITLPHSVSKKRTIIAFVSANKEADAKAAGADIVGGEDLIKEIIASKKTDFDVAIATPDMMKALAPAARVLGPRGLMPSPKNGTVTQNIKAAIEEVKKGKIDFKSDAGGNVHVVIGKASLTEEQLTANLTTTIDAIRKAKPASAKGTYIQNVVIASNMGPGIKVQVS